MSAERISQRIAAMDRELSALIAESFEGLSTAEQLTLIAAWETHTRRQAAVGHRMVAELDRAPAAELGAKTAVGALEVVLRISKSEASRRVAEARELAPRRAMTGEALEPVLAQTAAAQARGLVGAEHVRIIRTFFTKQIPVAVGYDLRAAAEAHLAELASTLTPEELRAAGERLAAHLNPDGDFSDEVRARKRFVRLGRQQADGMREMHGLLDPGTGAALEAVLAKGAAPGVNNPADDTPCVNGEPFAQAVAADTRSTGQRNHDALGAMCRELLASGKWGSHNGLPTTMVITTTLQELESGTGHAVTGGGSLVPMSEVIKQASTAHHYLAVFDGHTEEPLYLGRAKRSASTAQRMVLFANDRSSNAPCGVSSRSCVLPFTPESHSTSPAKVWACNASLRTA